MFHIGYSDGYVTRGGVRHYFTPAGEDPYYHRDDSAPPVPQRAPASPGRTIVPELC